MDEKEKVEGVEEEVVEETTEVSTEEVSGEEISESSETSEVLEEK